ncbi:linker for activation of T-cells family member 2 [Phaethornis superciliosus]
MAQLELLWAAAALMLLGATISLCLKCQLSAHKREKQLSTARRLDQVKEPENLSIARVPISLDYYNCTQYFTPPKEKEEDSNSYQNIIIGVSQGSDLVTDDAEDYENCTVIHAWKLQQAGALQAESSDDEPD